MLGKELQLPNEVLKKLVVKVSSASVIVGYCLYIGITKLLLEMQLAKQG